MIGAAAASALPLGGRAGRAQSALKTVRATFGPTSVLNAVNMIAVELGFARQEGLDLKLIITDAGAKTRQVLAAGEAEFAHGDATHPLQLSGRGKPSKILMATEMIASNSIIVVRKDLYDQGINSVEKLAQWRRPDGAKPIVAATAIGSSTWMFGTAIFDKIGAGDRVTWVAGGGGQTLLGALKTRQFDAIMAVPSWRFTAEEHGWGKAIFDIGEPGAWSRIFGGPVPCATVYALDTTVTQQSSTTQAYVDALYRSMQWVKTAPTNEVYERIGPKYLGEFDVPSIKREIAYYQTIWHYPGTVGEDDFRRAGPIWYREGTGLQEKIAYRDVVEPRFLAEASRKYG
jgi:NitT/TauT family transport system substrate-binding protein